MSKIKSLSLYDAKVFVPLLISLALLLGLFQNCSSSQFGYGKDPEQNRAQEAKPIIMSDEEVKIVRLEGKPLQLTSPSDLFEDQGLEYCPTAEYVWSFSPSGSGESPVTLSESLPTLQIDHVKMSDEGSYYLDVKCNSQTYNLGPAVLDVVPKLRLVNSNVTNQTVSEGSTTNLDASFTGPSPITYQWYFQPESGARVALAGETSAELKITDTQVSDQGTYEVVAASTEGGIAQSLSSGTGKLTVLPISAITGSVSGTSQVQSGEPIQLTSTVSGAQSPEYQWFFNSVRIDGANGPNFEIPKSQSSDSGTYSLVVTDMGEDYQIGSINVVVSCGPGEVLIGGQCRSNSRECSVENGSGIQFLESDGTYGECRVVSCAPGYVNLNNKCVRSQGSCPIEHGTGSFTYGSDGKPGPCIVQTCDAGYVNLNNKCEKQVCSVQNGVGLIHEENGSLVCKVEYCNPDFVKYQNKCVPRYQSCPIENGYGRREYTESGPKSCKVTRCNTGYVNINNSCVKRECGVANGQGVISVAPNGSIQCRAVSCNSGYFLYQNKCISQRCTSGNGTGYWVMENGQRTCKLTSCNGADLVLINNQCVSSVCPIQHGRGAIAIGSNGQTYCKPVACDPGYAIKGMACEPSDGLPCPIANGQGVTADGGKKCLVRSCNSGYVSYNNQCVKRRQSCSIAHGTGFQIFTSSGPGVCQVESCHSGYVQQGNQCVPKRQACYIENGTGYRTAYANGYGECIVESCDSGYGVTITQQCLPLRRPCYVGSGKGYQYLTSYGYSACQIETCGHNQTLIMGQCRVNERLLCEPTDKAKSAYGGKVFGHIFSLLNNKYNANVSTATQMSNRLNGHVFLNQVYLPQSTGRLYDTRNRAVQHKNGSYVTNWFGLALYTQLLPPDGAGSGHYILALASDDGSALDCRVNGSWKNFVNNNSGRSCSTIKRAQTAVHISRDKPMPIKVRYFQNSGSGRCLKLLYKRVGGGDFKVVPQRYLMLPDHSNNRCPR